MERINLKIDEEKKKEIVQHVEETEEYPTVSHFFRLAASREMADEEEQPQQLSPRVTHTLDKIVAELDEVQEGISNIAKQLESDDREMENLAQEVYDALPKAPVANSAEMAAAKVPEQQLEQRHARLVLEETDAPSTLPELARHLDTDKEDIKEAIRYLKSNFLPILELVDEDGNKHYLKQEERR